MKVAATYSLFLLSILGAAIAGPVERSPGGLPVVENTENLTRSGHAGQASDLKRMSKRQYCSSEYPNYCDGWCCPPDSTTCCVNECCNEYATYCGTDGLCYS